MDRKKEIRRKKICKHLPKNKGYKGLSLSSEKLKEITIRPKVNDGKLLFDKNNKDHRYIVEEGEYQDQ